LHAGVSLALSVCEYECVERVSHRAETHGSILGLSSLLVFFTSSFIVLVFHVRSPSSDSVIS
jgi:hypothetical protein